MSINLRIFLKKLAYILGVAGLTSILNAQTLFANDQIQIQKGKRPNIILIMADDMGFSDIGCYGGEIDTPSLDNLAANGIRFTQFYNTARCCPTRASLMTGLHPHQTGIGYMTNPPYSSAYDNGTEYPNYRGFLNRNCVTIAEVVKEAGYATMMTGKWHLGYNDQDRWPLQRGFEKYYGVIPGASNFFYPTHPRGITYGNEPITMPESTTDRRFYVTDAYTDYAIKFIQEEKADQGRPFFLYLAYTAPHWPLHAHQEEVAKYRGKYMMGWDQLRQQRYERQIKMGLIDSGWPLSPRAATAWDSLTAAKQDEMDYRMANYAAMIDRMDQNIGKLVDSLKAAGEFDNTLIMFLSDNGGCAEGGEFGGDTSPYDIDTWEHTYGAGPSYGTVWANASNTPFRKFKHYTHEGGMSTPFIAHWPAGIKHKGRFYREAATLIDVMPTVVDLTGARYPTEYHGGNSITPTTGVSLKSAFVNKSLNRSGPLCFEHENNAAIIDGDWKLVGTGVSPDPTNPSKWELYNIKDDRTELNDLKDTYPQKVNELAAKWEEWAEEAMVYPKP